MNFANLTKKELAAAYDVDPRTVYRWTQAGMPRNPDGTYSLSETIEWSVDRAREESPGGETEESSRWLAEWRRERTLRERFKRQAEEGSVIPKADVVGLLTSRIAAVRQGLLYLERVISPDLVGLNHASEAAAVVRKGVKHLLERFAAGGHQFTTNQEGGQGEKESQERPERGMVQQRGTESMGSHSGAEGGQEKAADGEGAERS